MNYTDLHGFIQDRAKELLYKGTLDSYRVKVHNAYTILIELKNLLIKWRKKQIKRFETVQLCIDEVAEDVDNDDCLTFNYYKKSLFLDKLKEFKKDGENKDSFPISFLVEHIIQDNENRYLKNLIKSIKDVVNRQGILEDKDFTPTIESLDRHLSALCTQLLFIGYSKPFLYSQVKKSIYDSGNKKVLKCLTMLAYDRRKFEFSTIFKLTIRGLNADKVVIADFKDSIPDEYLIKEIKDNVRFIKINPNIITKFYILKVNARDAYSAVLLGKEKLFTLLDRIQLAVNTVKFELFDTAFTLKKDEKGTILVFKATTNYYIDGSGKNYGNIQSIQDSITKIKDNPSISDDVKVRIDSAIRHIRIANEEAEIEQQFLNYWIALEFLFSSADTEENTYKRIKEFMLDVMMCSYAKRNMSYLEHKLIKAGVLPADKRLKDLTVAEIDSFATNSSILLRYRLKKHKSIFYSANDKLENYLKNHETNLIRHLSRIYSLRNELVHEAAIKQNIEGITSNLRYYLTFVMNQLFDYMGNIDRDGRKIGMSDFFKEYHFMREDLAKCGSYEKYFNVNIAQNLIN